MIGYFLVFATVWNVYGFLISTEKSLEVVKVHWLRTAGYRDLSLWCVQISGTESCWKWKRVMLRDFVSETALLSKDSYQRMHQNYPHMICKELDCIFIYSSGQSWEMHFAYSWYTTRRKRSLKCGIWVNTWLKFRSPSIFGLANFDINSRSGQLSNID